MKNAFIWIVIVVVAIAALFWYMNRSGRDVEAPALQEEEEQIEEQIVEALQPMVITLSTQNDSGMSGTATLTDMNGSTHVELDLTGAPEGVTQPAHIHTGSCADIGGVVYPLTFPVNGVSETTLDVSLEDLTAQLPLALNVHKSPEEANIYVACGDLS